MAISKTKSLGKRTRRSRAKPDLVCSSYIYKVLKQVHPDASVSSKAMNILEGMANSLLESILEEAATLVRKKGTATLQAQDVITAAALVLGQREVAKHAVSEAHKACLKWVNAK